MDIEKLNNYRAIVKLINKDKKRLEKWENYRPDAVFGKARGSSSCFPYTERSFSVDGAYELHGEKDLNEKIHDLRYRIETNIKRSLADTIEVENFIESINDPIDKQIFIALYLEGRKQEDVSLELNMERSGISKRVHKYVS